MGWEGQTSSAKSWAGIVDPESYTGLVEPGGVIAGSCDRKPGKEEVLLLKMKCSQGSGFGVGGKMVAQLGRCDGSVSEGTRPQA